MSAEWSDSGICDVLYSPETQRILGTVRSGSGGVDWHTAAFPDGIREWPLGRYFTKESAQEALLSYCKKAGLV